MKSLITSLFLIFIIQFGYAQEWETVSYLPNNIGIYQLKVVSEDTIYVAARYESLLRWDGNNWSNIGDFDPAYTPRFQYISADDIYATHNDYLSGNEENFNYIAHWDGVSWSNAGNLNVAKSIQNFKVISPTEIYAVGDFVLPEYRWKPVAKYNGDTWQVVGFGDSNAGAYSTYGTLNVSDGNNIYTTSGYSDVDVIRIKHWDGTNWSVLYNFNDSVNRLSKAFPVSENEVYSFGYENENGKSCIAIWNGEIWKPLGNIREDINLSNSGNNGGITFKYVTNDAIYAVGSFMKDADDLKFGVAKWNGTNWEELGDLNADKQATAIDIHNGYLYIAGDVSELNPSGSRVTVIKRYFIDTYYISGSSNTIESGSVEGTGIFSSGETASLMATPNEGYIFENWTENGQIVSIAPNYEFVVESDREIIANFQRVLAVSQFNKKRLVAIPNPFTDTLTINYTDSNILDVQIFDLLGRLVLNLPGNNLDRMQVNTQNLESGNYILKINNGYETKSLKVMKQ